MLFFAILSCLGPAVLTLGQVLPLYSTPRKTVTLSSNRGHVFREEGVWNYSTMLLREDIGVLILGARETIFALDLTNITNKKSMIKWAVTANMQTLCTDKGKTPTECQNYIRILHTMPTGTMYICGTNAFNPTCDYLSYRDGNLTLENKQEEGKGRCPFDPLQRYTSELVDGSLYSATSYNFLGSEPVLIRNDSIRTEFMTSWLNEPVFISMKHIAKGNENPEGDDDEIYLFFSETAVEYDAYKKLDVSRVARVCKGDMGGQRTLQKKWTSFLKARLDCSGLQTKMPLLIQDVFLFCPGNWKTCVFYGVFTPQTHMLQYSTVCSYSIQDIMDVFSKSSFKMLYSDTSFGKWVTDNGPVPEPRPGACINNEARQKGLSTSLDLPDKTLQFIRDRPLMDQAVKQSLEKPLLVTKGATFTRIVVASTTALDGSNHQVMFIGTASGSVLKAVNYDGKMVIIEEVQIFKQSEPVKLLHLSTTLGQLYAGSDVAVVQMPLSACDHYTSCMDCVLARDPYCGWNLTSDNCIAINNIQPDTHSEVVQNLRDGNASLCPAVGMLTEGFIYPLSYYYSIYQRWDEVIVMQVTKSTMAIKKFFPGNTARLPCQPGSNLAQVQWSVNGHSVENSNKYHIYHDSLLILNASDSDVGFYTCTSVESTNGEDYVTQNASYELRMGNVIDRPLVQPQKQQGTLLALKTMVIILALILLVLVVWNFYKGHLAIPKCPDKAKEDSLNVVAGHQPLQIENKATSTNFSSNRNNNHNKISEFPNTAKYHTDQL